MVSFQIAIIRKTREKEFEVKWSEKICICHNYSFWKIIFLLIIFDTIIVFIIRCFYLHICSKSFVASILYPIQNDILTRYMDYAHMQIRYRKIMQEHRNFKNGITLLNFTYQLLFWHWWFYHKFQKNKFCGQSKRENWFWHIYGRIHSITYSDLIIIL